MLNLNVECEIPSKIIIPTPPPDINEMQRQTTIFRNYPEARKEFP